MGNVRFAVVGCGSIANNYHLPALCAIHGAQFVAACDIIEERAWETAEKFGAEAHCLDHREAVARDDVDLVCVFTKIDSHVEIAIAAAEAGKHVFIQKPFARSLTAGMAMCAAAEKSGVEIAPTFMHRYFDECLAAAKLIREGRIGDVEFLRMRNGTMNARETAPSYGGALMDIGAHGIDLVRALTGQEIARVSARLGEDSPTPAPEEGSEGARRDRVLLGNEVNAWMQYELSGGTVANHEVQWSQTAGTSRFQAEVYGTEGTIFIRVPRTGEDLAVASGPEKRPDFLVPELPGRPMGQAHHEEIIRSVATGEWEAQRAGDGMAVLAVCEAARRAAESRRWVNVLPHTGKGTGT
ncbi:MAG: Gfo/Idh/MocA family oxidoreductase [Armatimonadota bacterium]